MLCQIKKGIFMKKSKEKQVEQIEAIATYPERRSPWGLVECADEPVVYKKPDHPRTEADYLDTFLDSVTQEDWGEVIKNTVREAKYGDAVSRNWLAQYLMAKPDPKVPTTIVSVIEPVKKN
jgi:hypothetical protein